MNNLMSNFSGLALTRMEMKKVTGGCYAQAAGPNQSMSKNAAQSYAATHGGHYCCSSCGKATWTFCGSKSNC
jgi:hypothetical protein